MSDIYLIDSKNLTEIADNIRDAGGFGFSSQPFTINNFMLNQNTNEYEYTWYRIIYGGSNQPSPGYSFSVELEGALATDIIQIDSISSAFNYDIQVRASRNYNNTKDTISVTIYSGENEVSGECTITGTLYHTGTGTGTVIIPAGEVSAGEAPSDKLEWPNGFVSAINNLPSVSTYGLNELFGMGEFTCLANEVKSYCFYNNEIITSVNLPNCRQVNDHAFTACSNLFSISLSNCNEIKGYAFDGCSSLNYISLPNCKILGDDVFRNCALSSIDLPKCESIGANNFYGTNIVNVSLPLIKSLSYSAFFYCSSLININMPECEYIGTMCFKGCTSLSEINFSQVKIISTQAFEDCTNLTTMTLPNCIEIGYAAFQSCNNLISISLPVCYSINSSAFYSCTNLSYIELPKCEKIYSSAFYGCQNLLSLYLMNSQVVTLLGSYQFNSTPIIGPTTSTSQQGYIYVPSSLYNDYIIASEWSYYSSYIVGV